MTAGVKLAKVANMETTVLKAKNNLSVLLRAAEQGREVIIRRGRNGAAFKIVLLDQKKLRTLKPDPRWKGKIAYKDEDMWASEWSEEA